MDNILVVDDLAELDAEEFDIPKVELPTLESILNESDDDDSLIDLNDVVNSSVEVDNDKLQFNFPGQKPAISELDVLKNWETMSITSNEDKIRKQKNKDIHGSVLSLSKLEVLTHQMLSAVDRVNAGTPTAMAVASEIAVGTARGLVLLFNSDQALKYCLGNSQIGTKYGSVSALTFNADVTRLLIGYARGEILMYDITTGKLLRTITDAHPPGSAILHVKFTDDPTLAICNDSGGSVFELNFRRVMGVRTCESRCLFSGSRGEVCTIETLHLTKNIADHPLRDRHILAMGTLTKVIIVTLRPQIKILFSHKLAINPTCVPLLAWQLVVFHSQSQRCIDPVLVFGRGDVLYFFQVKSEGWDTMNFIHLRTMNLTYKLVNLAWLNSRTILLLDTHERAHVIDVDSQEGLEMRSINHVGLVYSSATFKSIATGGNVSQALAVIGEHACYNSMVAYSGKVHFLGTGSVFASAVHLWSERIKIALSNGHKEALKLALTFYDGTAKAVLGLPADPQERKNIISETMLDILVEYVDLSMTRLCPDSGKLQVLINFYRNVVPLCVEHCLHIGRIDVLFGRIYERFKADCIAHGAFLECLEPYILSNKLNTISPEVLKSFVEHYQAKNMLSSVENCLLHLNVENMDLNQVMHLCWAHGLYDAIMNIQNRSLKDYIGPLCELLLLLISSMDTGTPLSDKMTTLGNKLLVYVSCSLAGVAYPHGDIDQETSSSAKQQMFDCLVMPTMKQYSLPGLYPVITALLRFSTKEFLNVLSLSFSEPDFHGSDGVSKVQNLVDVLLQVMLEHEGFKPDQVGSLFTFLARQSARQEARLSLSPTLKQQVVEFLTTPSEQATDVEERQQALVELLQCGVLEYNDASGLIALAERASFYRVQRFLHAKQRRFDLVFVAYLKDTAQKDFVFTYIRDTLTSDENSTEEKQKLKDSVLTHIKDLININGKEAAQLVTTVLQGTIQTISAKLQDDPFVLFNFLQGLFREEKQESDDNFIMESYYGEATEIPPPQPTDPDTCELYLSLMCQFKRDHVLAFVQDSETIRPQKALEIVRRHRVDDATAYLLEESGDVNAAFNILLSVARNKLALLDSTNADEIFDVEEMVSSSIDDVIRLCQRNSNKLLESQRNKLWFSLLDVVLKPQRDDVSSSDGSLAKRLARNVLTSMIGHMSLPAVLQKIIQDPAYKSGEFGEIKDLLMGMLETYQYERTLLNTTLNLLARDRHRSLACLRKNLAHAVAPRSQLCTFCRKSVLHTSANNQAKIIVFSGGTVYHESCLRMHLGTSSNPRVDKDRRSYELFAKQVEYREGLLGALHVQSEKPENIKHRARTSTFQQHPFDLKGFKLKTSHPAIQF